MQGGTPVLASRCGMTCAVEDFPSRSNLVALQTSGWCLGLRGTLSLMPTKGTRKGTESEDEAKDNAVRESCIVQVQGSVPSTSSTAVSSLQQGGPRN